MDLVVFVIREGELRVLCVKRSRWPFEGQWALPGGFVHRPPRHAAEGLEEAARRELEEETGLTLDEVPFLMQLGAFGDPSRDPERGNVVTVAHLVVAADVPQVRAGGDAAEARWLAVRGLTGENLAFDHAEIVEQGLERVRDLMQYTALATAFLPDRFSLSDLRRVYEIVWDAPQRADSFHHRMKLFVDRHEWLRESATQERPALLDALGLEPRRGPKPKLYAAEAGPRRPLERSILKPTRGAAGE